MFVSCFTAVATPAALGGCSTVAGQSVSLVTPGHGVNQQLEVCPSARPSSSKLTFERSGDVAALLYLTHPPLKQHALHTYLTDTHTRCVIIPVSFFAFPYLLLNNSRVALYHSVSLIVVMVVRAMLWHSTWYVSHNNSGHIKVTQTQIVFFKMLLVLTDL